MNRSKGTYLQGAKKAEWLIGDFNANSDTFVEDALWNLNDYFNTLEPYYDGVDFCNGFSDYVDHFTKNKELIVNHFRRCIQNAKS